MTNCVNLSKEIYKGGVKANFIYGGGLSAFYLNNVYVITEFSSVSTSANNKDGVVNGVADVYHVGYHSGDNDHKIHRMSLAEFLALAGTTNAPEGWFFKDGYIPCPIEGLEIELAPYLTEWGITLS